MCFRFFDKFTNMLRIPATKLLILSSLDSESLEYYQMICSCSMPQPFFTLQKIELLFKELLPSPGDKG